jgi:hypothetical protein
MMRIAGAALLAAVLAIASAVAQGPSPPSPILTLGLAGPCDVIAAGGQTCAAAHSVTRRMFASYIGPLFQLQRTSDTTTLDIGTKNGAADVVAATAFCLGTECLFMTIYDQSGNGNHLWAGPNEPVATAVNASPWWIHWQKNLPLVQTGFYIGTPSLGNFYRNRGHTSNLPTGASPSTTYYVRPTDIYGRWGDYGRGENPIATLCGGGETDVTCPAGASFAIGYSNGVGTAPTFAPPYAGGTTRILGVDMEYFMPAFQTASWPQQMIGLAKSDGTNIVIKYGDATSSALNTLATLRSPRVPLRTQNGLQFSEGGDATGSGLQFYEGAIISGMTAHVTDNAVASNVAAFYGAAPPTPATPAQDLYSTGGANNLGQVQLTKAFGGAYGLRRMNIAYTGYAALITRETDTTSLEVGFDGSGNFDDFAAQNFCASTICHAQLHNQAPTWRNNNTKSAVYNLVNGTLAAQPTLVFNGLNGRTVLGFNGSQFICSVTNVDTLGPQWFAAAVAERTASFTTAMSILGGNSQWALGFAAVINTTSLTTNTATTMNGATLTDNAWGLIVGQNLNGSGSVSVNNGTAVTAVQSTANTPVQKMCIGAGAGTGTLKLTGQVAEVIIGAASGDMALPTVAQWTALYNDEHAYYGGAF